jgi:hypothetical protein
MCLSGNDYRHKTITSNSTTYYQVLLTYNQERGPAQNLRNIAQIPIVWAEDSTTKQYASDIVTNFKNAAQSVYTNGGTNEFSTQVQPTEAKTLHWVKNVALTEAVAPWMLAFGSANAAYLKLVGADLSEIPIANEFAAWAVGYVTSLRGYAGSYWITWKDPFSGGAASIIEDWDDVEVTLLATPAGMYEDGTNGAWEAAADRATADTWMGDVQSGSGANPAYATQTRAAIEMLAAAGYAGADDAYAICQTLDGNSPITLGWRDTYPQFMYNASHVFVEEV